MVKGEDPVNLLVEAVEDLCRGGCAHGGVGSHGNREKITPMNGGTER